MSDRLGQASALRNLGVIRRLTGDYPAAAQAHEQALAIYRDLGERSGEAEALNEKGTLHRVSDDLAQAEDYHRQALDPAHAIQHLGRGARPGRPGSLRLGRRPRR